jgi:predicted  nucleic acid-binding Zn-ribbon protein
MSEEEIRYYEQEIKAYEEEIVKINKQIDKCKSSLDKLTTTDVHEDLSKFKHAVYEVHYCNLL